MKSSFLLLLPVLLCCLSSCIKDDIVEDTVEPELRITTNVDSIALDSSFLFQAMYLDNVGNTATVPLQWSSTAPSVIAIDPESGLAQAQALGSAMIEVSYDDGGNQLRDVIEVGVGMNTVVTPSMRSGTVTTTSSYALSGDFTLSADGSDLLLEFGSDYQASSALPGLFIYLSNNRNTTANALEIAAVQTFSGAHSYTIPNVGIFDYDYVLYFCKPFNVKVGDGPIQ